MALQNSLTTKKRIVALSMTTGLVAVVVFQSVREVVFTDPVNIPVPFQSTSTSLRGAVANIGDTGGRPIVQMTFDAGESSEDIQKDTLTIALLPNASTLSAGAPLSVALTSGKKIFGYKYSSRRATLEIDARARASAGNPVPFTELFPGQFFVSDEKRNADGFIAGFESLNNITFLPLSSVLLDKDSRYVFVALDDSIRIRVRDLHYCGDGTIDQDRSEFCDDGNRISGDGCSNLCKNEYCTDGVVDFDGPDNLANTLDDEQCDDGNINANDGCTPLCREEITKLSTIAVGPENWFNARSLCQTYVEDGLTNWSLPFRDQLKYVRQKLLDRNIRSILWAFDKPPSTPMQSSYTYDPVSDSWNWSSDQYAQHQAVCVNPTATYHGCTDSDRTMSDNWSTDSSKYQLGTVRITNGTEQTDYADSCPTGASLREYYCFGTELKFIDDYCPNGYGCRDGACRTSLPPGESAYPKPQCMDLLDNDRDGTHDAQLGIYDSYGYPAGDPGCASRIDEDESDGTTECQDGIDNDGDGKIDLDDSGCNHPTERTENPPSCTDSDGGVVPGTFGTMTFVSPVPDACYSSNTQYNLASCSGSDCFVRDGFCTLAGRDSASLVACSAGCNAGVCANPDAKPQCSDGIDNDGDGAFDYSGIGGGTERDQGCDTPSDNNESDRPYACQDGLDNDGDSAIDTEDPGCVGILDNNEANVYDAPATLRSVTLNTCEGVQTLIVDFGTNSENCTYLQGHWNGERLAPLYDPMHPEIDACFRDEARVMTLPSSTFTGVSAGMKVALFGQLEPKLHSAFVTVGATSDCGSSALLQ